MATEIFNGAINTTGQTSGPMPTRATSQFFQFNFTGTSVGTARVQVAESETGTFVDYAGANQAIDNTNPCVMQFTDFPAPWARIVIDVSSGSGSAVVTLTGK